MKSERTNNSVPLNATMKFTTKSSKAVGSGFLSERLFSLKYPILISLSVDFLYMSLI